MHNYCLFWFVQPRLGSLPGGPSSCNVPADGMSSKRPHIDDVTTTQYVILVSRFGSNPPECSLAPDG